MVLNTGPLDWGSSALTSKPLLHKGRKPLIKKLPESIEPSRFVSHREKMSGEVDSRKDSQSTKFE